MGVPFYYQRLKSRQAELFYRSILTQIEAGVEERYPLSMINKAAAAQDVGCAVQAIIKDRPDFFFLSPEYHMHFVGQRLTVQWKWLYPKQHCLRLKAQMDHELDRLVAPVTAAADVRERERELYRKLALQRNYCNSGSADDHSILNPLLHRRGVCDGYAKLFAVAARKLRIPAIVVSGESRSERHAWNMVQLGQEIYHLDVTWDGVYQNECAFDYFNLSQTEIEQDHSAFSDIPQTSRAGNYHLKNGCFFEKQAALAKYLMQKTACGQRVIRARLSLQSGNIAKTALINMGLFSYDTLINETQNTLLLIRKQVI